MFKFFLTFSLIYIMQFSQNFCNDTMVESAKIGHLTSMT